MNPNMCVSGLWEEAGAPEKTNTDRERASKHHKADYDTQSPWAEPRSFLPWGNSAIHPYLSWWSYTYIYKYTFLFTFSGKRTGTERRAARRRREGAYEVLRHFYLLLSVAKNSQRYSFSLQRREMERRDGEAPGELIKRKNTAYGDERTSTSIYLHKTREVIKMYVGEIMHCVFFKLPRSIYTKWRSCPSHTLGHAV